jgi:hypothetical protein
LFRKSVALAVDPNIVSNAKVEFCSKELKLIPVSTTDLPSLVRALIPAVAALAKPTPIAVLMVWAKLDACFDVRSISRSYILHPVFKFTYISPNFNK